MKIRKMFRKVFVSFKNGVLKFFGLRFSRTGFTRDIVYSQWGGNRNNIKHKEYKKHTPNKTYVVTDYIPPAEVHHSTSNFAYNIADRKCKRWTDEDWEEVMTMREKGYSILQIADFVGRTEESIKSKIRYMKKKGVI